MRLLLFALQSLYNILLCLLAPLLLLRLAWRGLWAPAYFFRWKERFGMVFPRPGEKVIWVHAVSVGEVQAGLPLVRALLARYPSHALLLTTMTPTGAALVKKTWGARVTHCYLPYDFPCAAARFLAQVRPRFGLILETELWPNLLRQCRYRGIPVMLVNARLSKRSARGYFYAAAFTRNMLSHLTCIAAQGKADARRFIALGAPPRRVRIAGNLKFELELPTHLTAQAMALRRQGGGQRPLWIAASTHEGEEALILAAFEQAQQVYPDLLLLLVPRHPERFQRVRSLCQRQGLATRCRSEQRVWNHATEVFIGDTMGELPLFFAASDVVFIGGSLVPAGGHNPLEPAALERAIIVGPYLFNFTEIGQRLLTAGAALQVHAPRELAPAVLHYLNKPRLRAKAGSAGRRVIAQNRGATHRLLQLIQRNMAG